MNIHELDSYDLGDAVKFNDRLNPKIWGADEKMRPEVREQLLRIADDFREFLGIDVEVKDITVSGSNAAYTYTPHSDIDLHLVVDLPRADENAVYRELFDAKKYAYNDMHDIRIGGSDVELYVQDANKTHHSQGIYSIQNDDWVSVPKRRRPDVDDISVRSKFEDLGHRIESAIASGDLDKITDMAEKLRDYRQAGLDAHGEFGAENLAFKILRTQGLIEKLYAARNRAKDELLSLDERRKKKKSVRYGYGGYWYPGTAYAGQDHPAGTEGGGDGGGGNGGESLREVSMSPDGVNPSTTMVVSDITDVPTAKKILSDFVEFAATELALDELPAIKLRRDPQWPVVNRTFGRYNDDAQTLEVAWGQRHIMDVLRTVAHELIHKHQHEREAVPDDAGETGSRFENEANARAGMLMRDYAAQHPEYFARGTVDEGMKQKAVAMAAAACLIPGTPGCSSTGQVLRTTQDVGRTAQTIGKMTRAGVQDEISQELRNFIRAQGGDPNAQNQSTLYQYQRRLEQSKKDKMQNEGASGYIPTKKQARDPRFSMALTQDIRPGQLGKEANKLKLKTDSQGRPQIARANGLFETLMAEYAQVKEGIQAPVAKDRDEQQYLKFVLGKIRLGRVLNRQEQEFLKMYNLRKQVAEDKMSQINLDQKLARTPPAWQRFVKGLPPQLAQEFVDERPQPDQEDITYFTPLSLTSHEPVYVKIADLLRHLENQESVARSPDDVISAINQRWGTKIQSGKKYDLNPSRYQSYASQRGAMASPSVAVDGVILFGAGRFVAAALRGDDTMRVWSMTRKQAVKEDEDLDEVKMSPSALEKFATSDAAKGIRAGFEAELIFRDTQGSSDDIDPEPNYDADERAYSIAQVIEFFDNDEYGYGLTDRERNRLEENLDDTYMTWRDNQITSDFRDDAEDLIRDVLLEETPLSERIIKVLTDGMDIDDARADKILAMGMDAPRFTNSSEQQAYVEQNPDYTIYLEALDDAEAILDEEVETSIEKQDGYYDQALDNYRDNWSGDDDSFFSDIGLRWMSDVANEYGLDWPVWDQDNQRNQGSRSWEDIGAELQAVVDMPVVVSDNYHSARRRPGQWILEPDGSLDPDDQSEEAGLEIVSPPMPLLTAIEKLRQVTNWANDPNGGNAYTNGTTGLHMGVSLPRFTSEDADSDAGIDYVKLILFMGDKYVLDQFGRTANTYTASALDKFRQNIKGKKSDPAGVVELLRYGLTELAYRELQKGVGTSKYTSAHIQNGYIEFRSPGGDWLAKSDEEIGILENTMLRFARAMAIAGDPSADRQEYAKKLYKLVTQDNDEYADQLKLFSEYSAGTINREQLKKQWAEKTIGKELGDKEEQDWEVYDVKTGKTLEIVKGKNRGEVADAVFDKYANQGIGFNVRAYQDPATLTPRAKLAKRITTKKIDYNYDIVDQRTVELRVVDRFRAETPAEAERVYSAWLKSKDLPDDTADYGYRKNEQAADDQRDSVDIQRTLGVQDVDTDVAQNFSPDYSAFERNSDRIDAIRAQAQQPRQNYELVSDEDPDRVIHRMNNATADEVRAYIAQQEAGGMPTGFLRTRIVAESTESQQDHTALDLAAQKLKFQDWADAQQRGSDYAIKAIQEIVRRTHSDTQPAPARSAIGQAINQAELDALTQQIQIARRLGDDVNEGQVVQMPANTAQARQLAKDWVGIYQDADATNRKQRLAAKQRELIALGWLLVRNPKYGVVLRHTDTGAMIPLNRITENFADGKNPGRKGLSRRVGIPKKATLGQLEKIAKSSSGERRRMAQWQLNMRRGKAKKK